MNTELFKTEDIPEPRKTEIFEEIYKSVTENENHPELENSEEKEPTDEEIIEILSPGFVY